MAQSEGRASAYYLEYHFNKAGLGIYRLPDHPSELREENERLRKALDSACGYMLNAKIDLETGTKKRTTITTLEGGLKMVREALGNVYAG